MAFADFTRGYCYGNAYSISCLVVFDNWDCKRHKISNDPHIVLCVGYIIDYTV